jgi:hypothetical protein
MLALLSQVERFTFLPKFQVNPEATLIAQSLSRQPDLETAHGSIQNALSLVIDRIAPNAPAQPKKVQGDHGEGTDNVGATVRRDALGRLLSKISRAILCWPMKLLARNSRVVIRGTRSVNRPSMLQNKRIKIAVLVNPVNQLVLR